MQGYRVRGGRGVDGDRDDPGPQETAGFAMVCGMTPIAPPISRDRIPDRGVLAAHPRFEQLSNDK
ncbi:hypothetical protein GCM10012280_49930 [Wenjunlia tyrosinilytica]|uniref:Uncharacterized protein n=1 Tax=Wenjunlia tyrosinilytica TaxID=1544741 RepID=A0A917ZUP7_9ACTN|nr:hypothetical protein GCM10012280_49930 [Wenjunlia tyrosinilytica]